MELIWRLLLFGGIFGSRFVERLRSNVNEDARDDLEMNMLVKAEIARDWSELQYTSLYSSSSVSNSRFPISPNISSKK